MASKERHAPADAPGAHAFFQLRQERIGNFGRMLFHEVRLPIDKCRQQARNALRTIRHFVHARQLGLPVRFGPQGLCLLSCGAISSRVETKSKDPVNRFVELGQWQAIEPSSSREDVLNLKRAVRIEASLACISGD